MNKINIPGTQCINDNTRAIAFSPNSRYLAVGSVSNKIIIYSIPEGEIFVTFEGHFESITSLIFSSDSTALYSSSFDGTVCIWNLYEKKLMNKVSFGAANMITSLVKDKSETAFYVSFLRGNVEVFNRFFTSKIRDFKPIDNGILFELSASLFDGSIASSSSDRTSKIWNFDNGQSLVSNLVGHNDFVISTSFSPFENICFTGSKDETVKAWNYTKGDCIFTLKAHKNSVSKIVHHPTQKIIASCSLDGVVCIWSYTL